MNQTIETGDIRKAGSNLHKNDLLSTYTFAKVLLYRTSSPITPPRINAGSFRGGLFQNSKKPVNCMFDGLLFHSDWKLLDYQDSNLDKQNQNLLCYHYTIVQSLCAFLGNRCKDTFFLQYSPNIFALFFAIKCKCLTLRTN